MDPLKIDALRRAAPDQWKDFVEEFRKHTEEQVANCVRSPIDMLQVTQGRAQECRDTLKSFEECGKAADRIHSRQTSAPKQRQS